MARNLKIWSCGFFTWNHELVSYWLNMRGEGEGGRQRQRAGLWLDVAGCSGEGGGGDGGMVGRRNRRRRVNGALWCIVGRRLQLPCRCAAWLTQRLAGSQSQHSEAVPLQFSVSERTGVGRGEGGRRHSDVKQTRGGSEEKERREAWEKRMGERGMRGGGGNGRRQNEKREGEADSAASIPADPSA